MADTAAHLVDRVLPRAPVRQWVLCFPRDVKFHLARDSALLSGAITIFMGEVFRYLKRRYVMLKEGVKGEGEKSTWRWRRRLPGAAREAQCGAVTAVQRYGSSLNLHPHLHSLVLDGVYVEDPETRKLVFVKLPEPEEEDLRQILLRVIQRLRRFLAKKGCLLEDRMEEPTDPGVLDEIMAGSIQELVVLALSEDATGGRVEGALENVVRRTLVVGRQGTRSLGKKPFCVEHDGYTLHAGVRIEGEDRDGLEKISKYLLRPAFAQERLAFATDGRVEYSLRRPRWDGGTKLIMTPVEFLSKLAALVPAPRSHLLRYQGVLGPHCRRRAEIVPPPPPEESPSRPKRDDCDGRGDEPRDDGESSSDKPPAREKRRARRKATDWATLLKRSIGVDVLSCPKCNGRMRVIAFITFRPTVRKILASMGLSSDIPVRAPPSDPPQQEFDFAQ